MKYNGAELIVKLLERQGISLVTGIPGGANLPLYHALAQSKIRHILARHEQGAGFIAQGMARSTGRAAVCLGTSGPGATNLLTAIADAKLDSIPLVAITGQVPRAMIGTDAFQEVDTFGLTLPITKHNYLVRNAYDLLEVIPEAFELAESGRPGPVAVDIPRDVQTEEVCFDQWPEPIRPAYPDSTDEGTLAQVAGRIREAKQPVLYVGGGIVASGASGILRTLAEKNNIPVTCTLMGLGSMPHDHPLFLGLLGMHGARFTNMVLEEADLLLALGVRFDDRATGRACEFCSRADIIHIDIDHAEINKIKPSHISLVRDAGTALRDLLPLVDQKDRPDWQGRVSQLREAYPLFYNHNGNLRHPASLIHRLGGLINGKAIITTDVGQHQMWVAQLYPFSSPRTFLTSGGLGTMGFGLPAAIGAAQANPGRKVVCISGDGSFLMNIQELATLAEQELNITVIIMNNQHLGLVRQQQELFYEGRIFASKFERQPDFVSIAQGFGIQGFDLEKTDDPAGVLETALKIRGPVLINAPVDYEHNVYPMVPPGASNREMIGGAERLGQVAC